METKFTEATAAAQGTVAPSSAAAGGALSEEWIREFPLFRDLAPARLQRLRQLLAIRHYYAGQSVYAYGDAGDTMAFLCKGTVEFGTKNATGNKVFFEVNEAGGFFGEVGFLHDARRSADATAKTEVFVLELHRDHLDTVLREFPEISSLLLRGMARRLSRSGDDIRGTITSARAEAALKQKGRLRGVVEFIGSLPFLYANTAVVLLWAVFHFLAPTGMRFDNYPFNFLALLLSIEALVVTTLVLKNQIHEEGEAQEREETHDRVNRETQRRLDELTAEIRKAPLGKP